MNGKDILKGLSYIDPKYAEEVYPRTSEKKHSSGKNRLLLIAAIAATMLLLLTGAAAYAKWSPSLEAMYHPSEDIRKQAEQSGLSVTFPQETAQAESEGLSAMDQGITVSVKQTVVDNSEADIVLKIDGLSLPEGMIPCIYVDSADVDGNQEFWWSYKADFYDGILQMDDGTYAYEDGTPAEPDHYTQSDAQENDFYKGHYTLSDGSMEVTLRYMFADTSGINLGKTLNLHITGFGKEIHVAKADIEREQLVSGSWNLAIPLTGAANAVEFTPNYRFADEGTTLLTASLGQRSGRLDYQLDSYFDGFDTLEQLQPTIYEIRMQDGSAVRVFSTSEGYSDEEKLLFYVEFEVLDQLIDPSQAQTLVFRNSNDRESKVEVSLR